MKVKALTESDGLIKVEDLRHGDVFSKLGELLMVVQGWSNQCWRKCVRITDGQLLEVACADKVRRVYGYFQETNQSEDGR